jgi:hypothetical protein
VSLPIVVVAHPVADRNEEMVKERGVEIAQECVRVLTTSAARLAREFEGKQYPLPNAVMPR